MFVMVACALIPRFELLAALGGRRELLSGPVALAPVPGGPQVVGAASGAAGAFGVAPGMPLAEALGRCPDLALVAPDPQRAEEAWERSLAKLESLGAAVESERPGEAFFGLSGLRAIWKRPEQVLTRARALLGVGSRLGAGPTRLCAVAAALRARGGQRHSPALVSHSEARAFLDPLPIGLLCDRLEGDSCLLADTLGRRPALPCGAWSWRTSPQGNRPWPLTRGLGGGSCWAKRSGTPAPRPGANRSCASWRWILRPACLNAAPP